jgi:hypothetical protein
MKRHSAAVEFRREMEERFDRACSAVREILEAKAICHDDRDVAAKINNSLSSEVGLLAALLGDVYRNALCKHSS